jgi:hypothetical protein
MTVIPTHLTPLTWPPNDFSLFLPLKIKLKGHHFGITEVIKAETQAWQKYGRALL